MRRETRRFFAPRGSAGRQQGQVVAALAIRDAVGDAISRRQAAVKPGPWPGRRAASSVQTLPVWEFLANQTQGLH